MFVLSVVILQLKSCYLAHRVVKGVIRRYHLNVLTMQHFGFGPCMRPATTFTEMTWGIAGAFQKNATNLPSFNTAASNVMIQSMEVNMLNFLNQVCLAQWQICWPLSMLQIVQKHKR